MRECVKTRPNPFNDMVFMVAKVSNVFEFWIKVEKIVAVWHSNGNSGHATFHSIHNLTCTRYEYRIDSDGSRHLQNIIKNVEYKSPWRPDNRILIDDNEIWPSEPGCPDTPQELQLDIHEGDHVEWFFYNLATHTWHNSVEKNMPIGYVHGIKRTRLIHTHIPKSSTTKTKLHIEYVTPLPETVFIAKPVLLKTCPLCNYPGEDLSFSFKCTNKGCKNSR